VQGRFPQVQAPRFSVTDDVQAGGLTSCLLLW
jgi:hypothetical protein